jgi:hypothetical protein
LACLFSGVLQIKIALLARILALGFLENRCVLPGHFKRITGLEQLLHGYNLNFWIFAIFGLALD